MSKEPPGETSMLKKVQSSKPMIYEGSLAGKEQKFLLDSGCTTIVVGRVVAEGGK
jgi:uncharacterized protein related to proFAR isomerase